MADNNTLKETQTILQVRHLRTSFFTHVGEVQVSVWPQEMISTCDEGMPFTFTSAPLLLSE